MKLFKEKRKNILENFEEKITLKILKKNNTVVSLGGGGFINQKNREEVLKNHYPFWLKWANRNFN